MNIKPQFIGIGLVLISWLTFFSPIISGQQMYFLDDLKIIYYPIETVYAQFQHSWQLPVWSNAFGFGQPLIAWGQLGFFAPIHVLLRALYVPPIILLQLSVILYFLLGSVTMYVFLRKRQFHPAAASLGAILFAYCGFSIGHLNHVNFYTSTMVMPILLIAIDAFIKKPTLQRAGAVALSATAIAMSGQPQVVGYVFFVSLIIGLGLYIPTIKEHWKKAGKTALLTIVAGIIAFCLSSLAILPLEEFVPNTDRGAGLPYTELFEFSYPPYETITLVFPYFFGDHANYNGPKGFQELAAYTGIIPIMLAGMALTNWRTKKSERISGIVLIVFGIALVLGKYSPVYHFLVDNHFIKTIGVVGRFVFFFDIGVLLLAALGLQDIIEQSRTKTFSKLATIFAGLLAPILLIAIPFSIYASQNPNAVQRLLELLSWHGITVWLLIGGIVAVLISVYRKIYWVLPIIVSVTLLAYGWNYNPRVPTQEALASSPFIHDFQQFQATNNGIPARLFAAQHLPVTGNPHVHLTLTDYIAPKFSVFQPLIITRPNLSCLTIPIQADSPKVTYMDIMIRSGFDGTIWYKKTISSEDAFKITDQQICFPQIQASNQQNLMLSFTSNEDTNMKVFSSPSINDQSDAYFMRVQQPTPRQLQDSKKPLSVQYTPEYPVTNDIDNALLMRNIQAITGASSASWTSALAIGSYRAFIDNFFANDADSPFDGDGIHALTRNRSIANLVGITHFTQSLDYAQTNDPMIDAGYKVVNTADTGDSIVRLYQNPEAYPKAFIVPNAMFVPADDDTMAQMRQGFDPKSLVYLSGPTPPDLTDNASDVTLQATANIISYTDTRVDVQVTANKTAYLVLTDSTLPEWQTYIDDKPALQLKADTIFKAAQIPAGTHIVSFRYDSPAINLSEKMTIAGIIACIAIYGSGLVRRRKK